MSFPLPSDVSSFPSPFLFLPLPSPGFFFFLRSLFSCFSYFFNLGFFFPSFCLSLCIPSLPICLYMCSCGLWFVFISLCFSSFFSPLPLVFLRGFFSLQPFQLYYSAVRFLLVFPPPPPPPPTHTHTSTHPLSGDSFSLFFAFPPLITVPICSPFFLLLRSPSIFVSFASSPCCCFLLLRWFSLSLRLVSFFGVVYPATGLPLLLGSHSFVVFSSAALASCSMSRMGGTHMFVLFHLPERILSLSLCIAEFILLIQFSCCFRLCLRCLVHASLRRMVLLLWLVAAPYVV